jgi:hypothetical protein
VRRTLALLLAVVLVGAGAAQAVEPIRGARTVGGEGGRVIEVTTLADDGPGSLREALAASGPRIVRFAVAGDIALRRPLPIREPRVTVAGETAPSPGITLRGATLRIRAGDVILRHIRVRVGDGSGSSPEDRDGIAVLGSRDGTDETANVLIEHCSISWSIDEGLSIWWRNVRGVTIRDSIVAEALDRSLHPKGRHSMGLLVGGGTRDVVIQRNLLAHNRWRNPVLNQGVTAAVINNLIYNPGNQALHFYGRAAGEPTLAAVIGNVVRAGPSTRPFLDMFDRSGLTAGSRLHFRDNLADGAATFQPSSPRAAIDPAAFVAAPPLPLADDLAPMPAAEVTAAVLARAGARPWDRDATDRRIVAEVAARTGGIRDTVPDGE